MTTADPSPPPFDGLGDGVVGAVAADQPAEVFDGEPGHRHALVGGLLAECLHEVALAGAGRSGDRLQHLRLVLPAEVRVTSGAHPLFGRLLWASGFKRLGGVLHLVVTLPDGSPGTIRADATGVLGDGLELQAPPGTVLSVEGIRQLRVLVDAGLERHGRPGRRKRA